MQDFTNSIRKSVRDENWFAALFLALCMPDICGAIETPMDKNRERYKKWFNENLTSYTQMFSAENAWHFRCGCLHQGIDADVSMTCKRVHFITPPRNSFIHRNNFNGVLQMQVDRFCNDIADAVDIWYENFVQKDPNMQSRAQELIKIYSVDTLLGPQIDYLS